MAKKRHVAGVAAGCAVAVASLLGTPSASAQDLCVDHCEPIQSAPGLFHKGELTEHPAYFTVGYTLDFPGNTDPVFDELKVDWDK